MYQFVVRCLSDAERIDVRIVDVQGTAGIGKTVTMIGEDTTIFELLLYF